MRSVCVAVALLSSLVHAQAGPQKPASADASALLKALGKLNDDKGFVLDGQVTQKAADDDATGAMMMMPGMGSAAPFEGKFEVIRPARGETLIVSSKGVPGFAIYELDDQRLTRTTVRGNSASPEQIAGDLSALLDLPKLTRIIGRSRGLTMQPGKDGDASYRLKLGPQLIPVTGEAAGGPMGAMMAPRVLNITATWKIDRAGTLTEFRYEVLRSNPMAAMQAKAGGGQMDEDAVRAIAEDTTPGATAIYKLVVKRGKGTDRAQEALKALRKLAEKE